MVDHAARKLEFEMSEHKLTMAVLSPVLMLLCLLFLYQNRNNI